MKQIAYCTCCNTAPHFDHYECSECHAELHQMNDRHNIKQGEWKYCPWCGVPLTKNVVDENLQTQVG